MIFSKEPLIIINDKGVYHQNVGLIKWEDIELVRTQRSFAGYYSQAFISVIANKSYMSSLSISRRILSSLNSALGGPGVFNIPSYLFNIPINDLARMIHQRYGANISLEIAD